MTIRRVGMLRLVVTLCSGECADMTTAARSCRSRTKMVTLLSEVDKVQRSRAVRRKPVLHERPLRARCSPCVLRSKWGSSLWLPPGCQSHPERARFSRASRAVPTYPPPRGALPVGVRFSRVGRLWRPAGSPRVARRFHYSELVIATSVVRHTCSKYT